MRSAPAATLPRPLLVLLACSVVVGGCTASTRSTDAFGRSDAASHATSTTKASRSTGLSTPSSTRVVAPSTTAPAFTSTVSTATAEELSSTYRSGCPVGPDELRVLHLSYWGFDGQVHQGSMVVNAAVVQAVLTVFSTLYDERFPIHKMVPEDAYGGSDPASMADDNTSGFNCRYAVAPGPPSWSVHAYGEAIDVNPIENPYIEGGQVQPPAGAAYTDRSHVRPGMAVPAGPLVAAFAAVGWQWGGRWTGTPDYQHFSANGN